MPQKLFLFLRSQTECAVWCDRTGSQNKQISKQIFTWTWKSTRTKKKKNTNTNEWFRMKKKSRRKLCSILIAYTHTHTHTPDHIVYVLAFAFGFSVIYSFKLCCFCFSRATAVRLCGSFLFWLNQLCAVCPLSHKHSVNRAKCEKNKRTHTNRTMLFGTSHFRGIIVFICWNVYAFTIWHNMSSHLIWQRIQCVKQCDRERKQLSDRRKYDIE